jgi:dolichol-phosphate mannosyltransferase
MKRVILTGGSGFVGANLARRLIRDGHELHLLLRPGHAPWRVQDLKGHARTHEVNLRDEERLKAVVNAVRPEWVFHLAVYGAYPAQTDLGDMIETNIVGTMNLVDACLDTGFEALVNTGSSSEYGLKDHAPSEGERLEPNSHYAASKVTTTIHCGRAARRHKVHIPTLRLYSVYGPYEEPSRLLPTIITRGLRGELPPLVNPETARDFVYVDDVVEAYLLAATARREEEPGAIYNVGTGVQTSIRQVVEIARRTFGIKAEPQWGTMPARQWDTSTWVSDSRKTRRELGWQPRFTFEQGFRAMAEWLKGDLELQDFYRSA